MGRDQQHKLALLHPRRTRGASPSCWQCIVSNADRSGPGRTLKLKVVFARPPYEDHLIFRAQAITLIPKLF